MNDIRIQDLPTEHYARFLEKTPHSVFHRPAWLEAVQITYGLRIRLLGYFRGDTLVAVTPLMGRRIGPFMLWGAPLRKCATPPATTFCSPAAHATVLLPHLHGWVQKERFGFFQATIPSNAMPDPFAPSLIEPLDNLEVDLRPPLKEIWKSMSEFPRRCVRKAVRKGVHVHWRHGLNFLNIQQALVRSTYERQGIRPNVSQRLYEELLNKRREVGVRVLCASFKGKIVAAIWAFADTEKCYYWDAASLEVARDLNANHLIVWCLIRWARRNGLQKLDFVGTSVGGRGGSRPGIGRFKQSMGGRPIQYSLVYNHSSSVRIAFKIYRFINKLKFNLNILGKNIVNYVNLS